MCVCMHTCIHSHAHTCAAQHTITYVMPMCVAPDQRECNEREKTLLGNSIMCVCLVVGGSELELCSE